MIVLLKLVAWLLPISNFLIYDVRAKLNSVARRANEFCVLATMCLLSSESVNRALSSLSMVSYWLHWPLEQGKESQLICSLFFNFCTVNCNIHWKHDKFYRIANSVSSNQRSPVNQIQLSNLNRNEVTFPVVRNLIVSDTIDKLGIEIKVLSDIV